MDNNKDSRFRKFLYRALTITLVLILLLYLLWYFRNSLAQLLVMASGFWNNINESAGGETIGVITGVISSILSSLLLIFIEYSAKDVTKRIRGVFDPVLNKINDGLIKAQENINISIGKFLNAIGDTLAETLIKISDIAFSIILFPVQFIRYILNFVWGLIVGLVNKLRASKWYYQKDAIDPGLVEVSLAVTAVLIALPSLISANIPVEQIKVFNTFRFLGEAIPTLTSISLLDRYAKGKGSISVHILLSPIVDGPLFFLGWSIVIGFIFIAIVAFRLQM